MRSATLALLLAACGDTATPQTSQSPRNPYPFATGFYTGRISAFATYRHPSGTSDLPSASHADMRFYLLANESDAFVDLEPVIPGCVVHFDVRSGAAVTTRCTVAQWGPTSGGGVTGAVFTLTSGSVTLIATTAGHWRASGTILWNITGNNNEGPIAGSVRLIVEGDR